MHVTMELKTGASAGPEVHMLSNQLMGVGSQTGSTSS